MVAVDQRRLPIQIADKRHLLLQAEFFHLALQAGQGRAFAGDHQQQVGLAAAQQLHHLQQQRQIFFVRHAADIQGHRPFGGNAVLLPKTRTIAVRKLRQWQAGGNHLDGTLDAISAQGVVHDA